MLWCEKCNKETRQLVKKRLAHKGRGKGHHTKREVAHCCECGKRKIRNMRKGTYYK